MAELSALLRRALLGAATSGALPLALLGEALASLARVGAPLLVLPAVAAGTVALLQDGPFASLEPLRPRLDRLDPVKGLLRVASPAALGRIALALAKAAVIGALLGGWLAQHGRALGQLPRLGLPGLWRAVPAGSLALRLALAALAFGAVDLALARRRHRRSLLMTRDEVRRESREDEGDPQRRAERRRLHRDLLEAGPVSKATVVVVNPAHVAVALQHRRGADEAPRVLAKGTEEGAARIRTAARRAGVPIVRDVPLARALARLVDVGEEIPPELYEAAAAVLVHVYGVDGGRT
jgi:type III secretion protein U